MFTWLYTVQVESKTHCRNTCIQVYHSCHRLFTSTEGESLILKKKAILGEQLPNDTDWSLFICHHSLFYRVWLIFFNAIFLIIWTFYDLSFMVCIIYCYLLIILPVYLYAIHAYAFNLQNANLFSIFREIHHQKGNTILNLLSAGSSVYSKILSFQVDSVMYVICYFTRKSCGCKYGSFTFYNTVKTHSKYDDDWRMCWKKWMGIILFCIYIMR